MKKIILVCLLGILGLFSVTAIGYSDFDETVTFMQLMQKNRCDSSEISKITVLNSNERITIMIDEIETVLSLLDTIEFETSNIALKDTANSAIVIDFSDNRLTKVRVLDNGACYIGSSYPSVQSSVSPPVAVAVNPEEINELINKLLNVNSNLLEYYDENTYIKFNGEYLSLEKPMYIIDGSIYAPLRNIFEKNNFKVEYDGLNKIVEVTETKGKVEVSDKTALVNNAIIHDEATALAVGGAILQSHAGIMEYETDDGYYYLSAKYNSETDNWKVFQSFRYKDEHKGWQPGEDFYVPSVELSRQTGEVKYINTYSSFD